MSTDSSNISPVKLVYDSARRKKIPIEYRLANESGPAHAKLFTMELRLGEKIYTGVDRSIKLAQRAAAQTAIDNEKISLSNTNHHDDLLQRNPSQLATVVLNTWASRHHIPTRYIHLDEQIIPSVSSFPRQIYFYRLSIGEKFFFDGQGSSTSKARLDCATHAWNFLRENETKVLNEFPSTSLSKSPISEMYERAKQFGLNVEIEWGENFTVTYRIGENYVTTGNGSNKQTAKLIAAEKMLQILPLPSENKSKSKTQPKRTAQHQKFVEQRGSIDYNFSQSMNPITRLYQIGQARHVRIQFDEIEKLTKENLFHFRVQYDENISAEGFGPNKQSAKRSAAENLLVKLNVESNVSSSTTARKSLLKNEKNLEQQREEKKKHVHFREEEILPLEKSVDHSSSMSIKQQLIKACEKLNIHSQYDDQLIDDESQRYQSILSLAIDDRLLARFRGQGASIRRAQENVSTTAWTNLQQLFNGSIPTPKPTAKISYRRIETSNISSVEK